jgi:hypothetical protein
VADLERNGEWGVINSHMAGTDQADAILDDIIIIAAGSQDYTVVYTTSPPKTTPPFASAKAQQTYEMETPYDQAIQMELKRDLGIHKRASPNEGGLFERYQYFSPGMSHPRRNGAPS